MIIVTLRLRQLGAAVRSADALLWSGEGGAEVTKRKADYRQTETGLTTGTREPLEGSTEEEIASCAVAGGSNSPGADGKGMEAGLFEDLLGSVREAGAILRGEREAARRTRFDDLDGSEADTAG